jgi:acyl-coenzyme A synthetase/AMP-(fatty) acid ligase
MTELERVVFAGEAFPAPIINKIRDYKNGLEFYNIYGQSESIACTTYLLPENIPEGTKYLPVGNGLRGVNMLLVDDEGNQISEANKDGELYISGDILFDGYLNLPDVNENKLVAPSFSPDTVFFRTGDCCFFDTEGVFYFKGRLDNQVQINGSRVELDEIEAVISYNDNVSNVCALLFSGLIICFISLSGHMDHEQVSTDLKELCMHSLPYYMRPNRYVVIEEMPITTNGKNDRETLKELLTSEGSINES